MTCRTLCDLGDVLHLAALILQQNNKRPWNKSVLGMRIKGGQLLSADQETLSEFSLPNCSIMPFGHEPGQFLNGEGESSS